MSLSHELRIVRSYDEERARRIQRSLSPEMAPLQDARSVASVSRAGGQLIVEVEAADLVALRAATNTWFGLVRSAEATDHAAATGY